MKTPTRNTLKNTVSILTMSFLVVLTVNAQKIDCAEVAETNPSELTSVLMEIGEEDYSYFLNVMSLKKYSNIIYDGLSVGCYKDRYFNLTSNGGNMELNATYRDDGSLVEGRLIKEDAHLPLSIRRQLPGYRAENWIMVNNKIFINDFDPLKTEYEIKFQRDNKKQTLFFDHSGKRIKRLSRS